MTPILRAAPLAGLVLLASLDAAAAHAHLKAATPAAGATVATAPTELRLAFSEGVNPAFTGAAITGPGGTVPAGKAALARGDDHVLVVPLGGPLAPGAYAVEWHALATDGHKTSGRYGFTVKP